jgi:dTDP-4-amino-4,6-dideoxygalactose transaminase
MVPFMDLKAQYHTLRDDIQTVMNRVLESSQYSLGDEVRAFEQEFATYCGTGYGVGVNSGASALHLALLAAGVKPGDEVVTVAATFVATVAAIGYTGARAVLVDVDPLTLNMDVRRLESALSEKTRVILPVHLHGQPADMDAILSLARARGITVIEDAAQAHGALYKSRRCGSLADMGCFSFYPGKNLGAYGEAGMVVTDNPDHAQTLRMLRDWGQARKYDHRLKGYNYRMDNLQAAVLRVKLGYLDEWNQARRQHAAHYRHALAGPALTLPAEALHSQPVYHVYAIRSRHRDGLQEWLSRQHIQTGIHYPVPVHLQPAYAELGYHPGDLPITEQSAREMLSLPLYPELSEQAVETVSTAIREFFQQQQDDIS